MTTVLGPIGHALGFAFAMVWEILWALILGFALSGVVQAVVSKRQMSRLLPDDSSRTLAIACALGAASSSCSYAAVALARSIFRKGANFTAAMAFEFASTNLVVELSIIMILVLGWPFAAAEFFGGVSMVAILALLFRAFLRRELVEEARRQADRGLVGSMEGHAEMDMSVTEGTRWQRITSARGFTAISHYFVMDWVAVSRDVAGGLLLVRLDGARGPGGRVVVSRAGFRPVPAAGHRDGAARDVQLHDGAESQLPRAGGRARCSVHAEGRAEDAADDESARRSRPRWAVASPRSVLTARVIVPASCERAVQSSPWSPSSCGRFPPRWPWHRAIAWLWARCARARAAPRPVSRRARRSVT